jgi:hypothetical protein
MDLSNLQWIPLTASKSWSQNRFLQIPSPMRSEVDSSHAEKLAIFKNFIAASKASRTGSFVGA